MRRIGLIKQPSSEVKKNETETALIAESVSKLITSKAKSKKTK